MKRLTALLLAALMILPFAACVSDDTPETAQTGSAFETEESLIEDSVTDESTSADEQTTESTGTIENDQNMENIIDNAIVLKLGNTYALMNGQRIQSFNNNEVPFASEGVMYVSSYFLLDTLSIYVDSADTLQKDGIEFVSTDLIEEDGYFVFTDNEHEIIVIAESKPDFEIEGNEKSFARSMANTFALGDGDISVEFKGDRPVLFTTDEMISDAKTQALAKNNPWYSSISEIQKIADSAIAKGPAPDMGTSATAFRLAACADMINAHNIALTYRYTEDEKYLEGAIEFLLAYAKPKLGTDRYLIYTAATTDGKADIGLNIAAPLTTACEAYSLIYPYVEKSDRTVIESWIRTEAKLVVKGHQFWIENNYYQEQYGNNHLTSHLMGIVAAAFVLQDDDLLEYALSPEKNPACLSVMINYAILMDGDEVYYKDTDSDFRPGEIYDRYRVVSTPSNGFGYSMYHLKFLTHTALMLYNNGVDYFSYFGENGENMKLSFLVYADYLIQNDSTLYGGHYTDNKLNRENAYCMYLLANHVYNDDTIQSVIDALDEQHVRCTENELFGGTALFTFSK